MLVCPDAYLGLAAPRLHPAVTLEVAPNESQRSPKPTTRGNSSLRGVVRGPVGSGVDLERAHNPKVAGSLPPFAYPDFTQELVGVLLAPPSVFAFDLRRQDVADDRVLVNAMLAHPQARRDVQRLLIRWSGTSIAPADTLARKAR